MKDVNINKNSDYYVDKIYKQKTKESPSNLFLLTKLHHLFYDKEIRKMLEIPFTLNNLSKKLSNKRNRPDIQYFLKYLIKNKILLEKKNRAMPLEERKTYIVDLKALKNEIDGWEVLKNIVDVYLNDCGVDVILENE